MSSYPKPIKPAPHCPITGRDFFMSIKHPDLGLVATYGGPFDSYTIPEWDQDECEFRSERYDHDADTWVEGGEPYPFLLVMESALNKSDDEEYLIRASSSCGSSIAQRRAERSIKKLRRPL